MMSLLDYQEYADVAFLVDGEIIYANRAILAVRSEYFRAMFYRSGMREQQYQPHKPKQLPSRAASSFSSNDNDTAALTPIEMLDISRDVFLKVLEFLYTDSVKDISHEISIPLLIVSERFCLDRLKRLCEDALRRDIDVNNVISIYITSYRHHAMGLKDIALEFILCHMSNPVIVHGLNDLKAEPDLLVEIIQCSSGCNSSMGVATAIGSGGHYRRSSSSYHNQQQPREPRNSSGMAGPSVLGPFGNGSEWSGTRR